MSRVTKYDVYGYKPFFLYEADGTNGSWIGVFVRNQKDFVKGLRGVWRDKDEMTESQATEASTMNFNTLSYKEGEDIDLKPFIGWLGENNFDLEKEVMT